MPKDLNLKYETQVLQLNNPHYFHEDNNVGFIIIFVIFTIIKIINLIWYTKVTHYKIS